ncbi:GNAT family N-acetyltransferase [Streptomyces halobius]|uniref:GNAT family N-acetyltransferase n=1 Tax=Streptomyces halobius TaxID=2879846 RepID=A0ABY4MDY5_9ACTN|nr:GNAT family N-acetyltransferase [Streptomyces halobius]UQA95673.1 GNAT family N-acetyltransferase [Streptomyces halobius]
MTGDVTGAGVADRSFTVTPGDPEEPTVARMLRRSEEYAHELYPVESVHMLHVEELRSPSVRFLVARAKASGAPLACGAVVLYPDRTGEIKRMCVDTGARRQGVGAQVLAALESAARVEGVRTMRLETGVAQPEAIALYRTFGYAERGPFGSYRDDPLSIFMERHLDD